MNNKAFEDFARWAQPKMSEFEREVFQEFKGSIKCILLDDYDVRPFPDELDQAMEFANQVLQPNFQLKVVTLLKEWCNESLDQFNALIITREDFYSRMSFYRKALKSTQELSKE
jgi:hypothetical protein